MQPSQERAEAVRVYFIKKSIDPSRLIAAGFDSAAPIANNETKARVRSKGSESKDPTPGTKEQ